MGSQWSRCKSLLSKDGVVPYLNKNRDCRKCMNSMTNKRKDFWALQISSSSFTKIQLKARMLFGD